MTIQTWSAVSIWSWTVTTFWCSILARASASRRARCIAAACASGGMALRSRSPLTATNRRSRLS